MVTHLSTRAFKFLRHISRRSGLQCADEEIHDMGIRLLTLCGIAAKVEKERAPVLLVLSESEARALKIIEQHFAAEGHCPSARLLSRALGYRSSRSGHLMLQRLLNRGILARHAGRFNLVQKIGVEQRGNQAEMGNPNGPFVDSENAGVV